jgi:hypothetical protein
MAGPARNPSREGPDTAAVKARTTAVHATAYRDEGDALPRRPQTMTSWTQTEKNSAICRALSGRLARPGLEQGTSRFSVVDRGCKHRLSAPARGEDLPVNRRYRDLRPVSRDTACVRARGRQVDVPGDPSSQRGNAPEASARQGPENPLTVETELPTPPSTSQSSQRRALNLDPPFRGWE